jgi:hypothetical protein
MSPRPGCEYDKPVSSVPLNMTNSFYVLRTTRITAEDDALSKKSCFLKTQINGVTPRLCTNFVETLLAPVLESNDNTEPMRQTSLLIHPFFFIFMK